MSQQRARGGWRRFGAVAATVGVLSLVGCTKDEGSGSAVVISTECGQARTAMGEWIDIEVETHRSINGALGHWADLYNQAIRGISDEELDRLLTEFNSDLTAASATGEGASDAYLRFRTLADTCTAAADPVIPPACAAELAQADALAAANQALNDAENAALAAVKATQDALPTGDTAAINAAVGQGNLAADQHTAATQGWNDAMDDYNATIDACNAALA